MPERTFYDRKQETNILKEKYGSLKFGEMLVIYGRRRVGKTELIKQFIKTVPQKKSLYLYVDLINKQGMLNSFSLSIQEQLKENVLFSEFEDFLRYVEEKSNKEKFVLVIDEFQRFLDISPDFITKLQNYWDSILKNKKLMLILVGSSIGMIQKITNSKVGALYGRGTKIKISPFRYVDFRLMFNTLSEEEKILVYSVFGGTPYYLEKVKMVEGDIYKKIYELITKKGAELFEEPKNLLEYENIRIHAKYNSILQATSSGKETLKEIEDFTKISSNILTPYLSRLDELLDLLGKKNPILGKERLGRYCVKDNFFKFWYKFIFPNQSALNLGNINFVDSLIKENLNSYVGRIFEDIVRELLVLYNTKEIKGVKLNFENIGSWWNRGDTEIDILAYNLKEKRYLVGEIKWTNKKLDLDVVQNLERKYKLINRQGKYDFIFVSKSGFTESAINRIKEINGISLDLKEIEELFGKVN
jgi:uncharacterized protein